LKAALAEIRKPISEKAHPMFFTIALSLLMVWLLGLTNGYKLGGSFHILLAVSLALFVFDAIGERRKLRRVGGHAIRAVPQPPMRRGFVATPRVSLPILNKRIEEPDDELVRTRSAPD
jgi:hypothetical protein